MISDKMAAKRTRQAASKPPPPAAAEAAPAAGHAAARKAATESAAEAAAEAAKPEVEVAAPSTSEGGAETQTQGDDSTEEDESLNEEEFCPAGDDDWEETFACPLSVRFTQDKIHPFLYRRGPIVNVVPKIRSVLRDATKDEKVVELCPPFSAIHCLRKGEELWSLDNRRLYALQLTAMEQWPQRCRVRLFVKDQLPRHKFKTQHRKFNTTSNGGSISLCARFQQFDTWSWFERAVEIETNILSQRLVTILLFFEIMPVCGALLFRTGLTGFATRAPLVAAFVLALSLDVLRQNVPMIERKICELHVRAVQEGEVQPLCPCSGRLRIGRSRLSAPQLAVAIALVLLLLLPYVAGLARARLRSMLFSCWLGVACVLALPLVKSLSSGAGALSGKYMTSKGRD